MTKKLLIEGTSHVDNGSLRVAFGQLLEKRIPAQKFTIKMGGGKQDCLRIFRIAAEKSEAVYLLIDLDKHPEQREQEIKNLSLSDCEELTFFMIQQMEAWFLSQPDALRQHYGVDLSNKLRGRIATIENPCEKLRILLKPYKKDYHKVKDGVKLLQKLDLNKLAEDFEDVKRLLEILA